MIDVFLAGDLGGTKMAAALVDATGNILIEDSAATEAVRGIEDVTERFAGLLLAVQRQGAPARPAGVGAGTPGLVDWPAGVPLVRPPDNVNPDCRFHALVSDWPGLSFPCCPPDGPVAWPARCRPPAACPRHPRPGGSTACGR